MKLYPLSALVGIFLAIAAPASATVTIEPATLPAVVEAGVEFGPLRIRVTDESGMPVGGAFVQWPKNGYVTAIRNVDPSHGICPSDPLAECRMTTDAQGMAELPRMYSIFPGTASLTIRAYSTPPFRDLGSVTFQVTVVPYSRADSLQVVSGDNQRVVATATLPQPVVVRAVDFQGRPLAGQVVTFSPRNLESGSRYAGGSAVDVVTDAQGIAVSPPVITTEGIGTGVVAFSMPMTGTQLQTAEGVAHFTATAPDGRTSLALQDMWWSGFDETGWGLSIAQHDDRMFAVVFAYDAAGLPTWHVLPSGAWVEGQRFSRFVGTWYSPRGTPYFAYDASRLAVGGSSIVSALTFSGDAAGRMEIGEFGQQRTKRIIHQDFTYDTPSPITGLGDMWWGGPSQNGWGISIMEQHGGLFSVWFTYDAQGAPTWFVMSEGRWTGNNTYEGPIYRTRSSSWPDYDARRLQVFAVGTYRYTFADTANATFEYSIEANSGSMAITRQGF